MPKEANQEGMFRNIAPYLVVAMLFLMVGFFLHPFYARYAFPTSSNDLEPTGRIKRFGKGKFTNPILECEIGDKKEFQEFEPLQLLIKERVETEIKGKAASKISVYFRGMTSGRWSGVNEDDTYPGGSLIKIPFLMAYYKMADTRPGLLSEQITYKGDFDDTSQQITKPSRRIEAGKSYSIDELIYRMIVYSGNNSTILLMRHLDRNYLDSVFGDFGVPKDQDVYRQWLVTTKTFSYFFRSLYNATYISQPMSERALELLSQTEFQEGLVAGTPSIVKVAHKFGEEIIKDTTGHILSASLHDCGIIYHRDSPYFLCIMTEGYSFEHLKGVISRIAKEVYTFVDSPLYPPQK